MKILLIRLSSIGDIVLCSPVIRCLKTQIPDLELHFLCKDSFKAVVEHNPFIDRIHYFENYKKIKSELKPLQFDQVIDLHNNQRTYIIKKILRVPSYSFDKQNIQKWIYCNFKINLMRKVHIVERYMETIKHLRVKNDNKGLDYFIAESDKVDLNKIDPEIKTDNYIVWVIGGQHKGKIYPSEKIISITKQLKQKILLLGGPDDVTMGKDIAEKSGHRVFNTCGQFSLNQSASIIQQSRLLITNDTGLMHIAAAFKKKLISLWGGTVPEFGMYPYMPHPDSKILVGRSFLSPSSKLGKPTLFNPSPMDKIPESEVLKAVEELW
ncbi:MAG: glycosyltransferase family 9 protein [Chitinophagales bacterium]